MTVSQLHPTYNRVRGGRPRDRDREYLGVSDEIRRPRTYTGLLKNLHVEGPVFYVYLPHRPKSALECAGVLVSRFKMKIDSLSSRLVAERRRRRRSLELLPSGSGLWKKKPSSRPLTCTFITLHCCRAKHPASRAAYRDLTHPRFPSRAPEELRFAGATRCLLSPQETREPDLTTAA